MLNKNIEKTKALYSTHNKPFSGPQAGEKIGSGLSNQVEFRKINDSRI
jgi:hypothetical protein